MVQATQTLGLPLRPTRRARPPLIVLLLMLLSLCASGCATANGAIPVPLSKHVDVGQRHMGIRLLGSLRLPRKTVDGLDLVGISALAWDDDEQRLYALSDFGRLFHLRPLFRDGQLRDVEILNAYPLRDVHDKPIVPPWRDAEGLTLENADNGIRGDTELLASFEVKQRIRRYTPQGKRLGEVALPPALRNIRRFVNGNVALEAITIHPEWGVLIAPERPLRGRPRGEVSIYTAGSNDLLRARRWRYPLFDAPKSSLVAMEALADGSLITLERAFVSLTRPLVIALRRSRLTSRQQGNRLLTVKDIAVFSTSRGWLLDNFEGLTRHRDSRFFMVSDDNRSFLQSTLLVYFDILN